MFKTLLDLGDRYAKTSNWTDYALTKCCLFSMGLAVGMQIPDKHNKAVLGVSAAVFAATYIPLMIKLVNVAAGNDQP